VEGSDLRRSLPSRAFVITGGFISPQIGSTPAKPFPEPAR
jgi:hypothetical protein